MEIKYESADDCIYAELAGELDEYSAEYVRISLDELLNGKTDSKSKLVLDFSKVSFMDSTGIGLLIGRYKKLKKFGVNSYITGANFSSEKILELSGLYSIMPKC